MKDRVRLNAYFYVYIIFFPNGIPCYVGKGSGGRWEHHVRKSHNKFLERIFRKHGRRLPIIILRDNLTERDAFITEIALIKAIGRRDEGKGTLVNHTDGGEGGATHITPHTEETKKLLSRRRREWFANLSNEGKLELSARRKRYWSTIAKDERRKMAENWTAAGQKASPIFHKGESLPRELALKMSDTKRNSPLTERQIAANTARGLKQRGRSLSNEHRVAIGLGNKGIPKPTPPDTIIRIALTMKEKKLKWWRTPENTEYRAATPSSPNDHLGRRKLFWWR